MITLQIKGGIDVYKTPVVYLIVRDNGRAVFVQRTYGQDQLQAVYHLQRKKYPGSGLEDVADYPKGFPREASRDLPAGFSDHVAEMVAEAIANNDNEKAHKATCLIVKYETMGEPGTRPRVL